MSWQAMHVACWTAWCSRRRPLLEKHACALCKLPLACVEALLLMPSTVQQAHSTLTWCLQNVHQHACELAAAAERQNCISKT